MSNNTTGKVVHEAEAHRQHVRIKLPGKVIVRDVQGRAQEIELSDISAGGLALNAGSLMLEVGKTYKGELVLKYDTFSYSVSISFQPRTLRNGRIGCMFQDVGPREADALRAIIGSFLAGDVLQLNDMLHIVKRDNTAPARKSQGMEVSIGTRAIAALGTLLVLLLGLVAFSYVFSQVYQLLFVTQSTTAVVTSDTIMLRMPENGIFLSLLKPGEHRLKKGQPLGTFKEVQAIPAAGKAVPPLRQITIMSPCDCDLMALPMGEAGLLQKGDPLFQLRTFDSRRWIAAGIAPEAARRLRIGDTVRVGVDALDYQRWGTVTMVEGTRRDNVQLPDTLVHVTVEVPEGIPSEALGLPAKVSRHPAFVMRLMQLAGR